MKDHDNFDMWAAVAFGALIGIGTALIVRARQEDDTHALVKRLRPVRRSAEKAARGVRKEVTRQASRGAEAGENLLDAGRDMLDELRENAGEILRNTQRELQKAAKQSVREAQRATRKARRAAF
jgi:gas vesicle protein